MALVILCPEGDVMVIIIGLKGFLWCANAIIELKIPTNEERKIRAGN